MFGSTHTIRRLAGLAVVAGAFAAFAPVAQADSGFQGEHDAVDPVTAMQRAQQSATFDGREYARLEVSSPSPDVAILKAQQSATFDGRESARLDLASRSSDVLERAAFQGEHDAVDPVTAMQRARQSATFDGREYARLDLTSPGPDVIERAVRAQELNVTPDLSGMPDVLERTVAAGQLQYLHQPTTSNGFDWNDFGIGAGAGIGLMLVLGGLGAFGLRRSDQRVSAA